jgi:tetratricopeptide (TPR) repeat protein
MARRSGLTPTAVEFINRGNAWFETGDNDRAIADYGEAIRLNSKLAVAFYDRAMVWRQRPRYRRL